MDSEKADPINKIEVAHRVVWKTKKFKYLEEPLTPRGNEKEALGERVVKIEWLLNSVIVPTSPNLSPFRQN